MPLLRRCLRLPALLALLVLGLAAPARATVNINTDTTINTPINDGVQVTGTAVVNLVPGGSISGTLFALNNSNVTVSGGSISGAVVARDSGMVTLSGGSVGLGVSGFGNSAVTVSGGTIGEEGVLSVENSMVTISGGTIGGSLVARDNSTIHVHGSCLALADGRLSGALQDGTPIDVPASGNIVLHGADTEPPSITCPANRTVNAEPGSCSATVPIVSPLPLLNPTVTDNCRGTGTLRFDVANNIITVPTTFPSSPRPETIAVSLGVGTHPVLVTATDAAGNRAPCTYTITVRDTKPPTITCPPDVIVPTLAGLRAGVFTPTAPPAQDNCPGVTVTGRRADGHLLTDRYPVGATAITWTATDASGNTAECVQTVNVHDPRIVGVVGLDTNGNGLPDPPQEPRLKGVVIELRDPAADEFWAAHPETKRPDPLDQTTTNEVGNFTFLVAPPGVYDVVVKPGPGQAISALFPGPSDLVEKVEVNGEPRLRVTMRPGQTAAGLGILLK